MLDSVQIVNKFVQVHAACKQKNIPMHLVEILFRVACFESGDSLLYPLPSRFHWILFLYEKV